MSYREFRRTCGDANDVWSRHCANAAAKRQPLRVKLETRYDSIADPALETRGGA